MTRTALCIALAGLLVVPLAAQPAEQAQDLDRAAAEQKLQERVAFFEGMGIEHDDATMLAILTEAGMDPAQLALMMMMGARGGGEEAMIPFLLMTSMRGGGAASPAMIERDGRIFIAEAGTLYVIDEATLEVIDTLRYAPRAAPEDNPIWSLLGPMIAGGRDQAQQTVCRNNLRQLGLAFMLYAQDHDNWLPDEENWVEAVFPYIKNRTVFTCPARPEQPVGYALNRAVLAQRLNDLRDPSRTVLAFETLAGGEAPVGGAELVPPEGIHKGGIDVVFADGHVERVGVDEAIRLLRGE